MLNQLGPQSAGNLNFLCIYFFPCIPSFSTLLSIYSVSQDLHNYMQHIHLYKEETPDHQHVLG